MADIIFNGNGPKPERARVWNVQREFTSASPPAPCQLHVMLEADMDDESHLYKKLTLNPGKLNDWGCEAGTFERLFVVENLKEATEAFLNEYAPVEELEDMFLC